MNQFEEQINMKIEILATMNESMHEYQINIKIKAIPTMNESMHE